MLHRPGQSHENVTVEERLVGWARRRVVMQTRPFHLGTVALRGGVVERELDPLDAAAAGDLATSNKTDIPKRFGVAARRTNGSGRAENFQMPPVRNQLVQVRRRSRVSNSPQNTRQNTSRRRRSIRFVKPRIQVDRSAGIFHDDIAGPLCVCSLATTSCEEAQRYV